MRTRGGTAICIDLSVAALVGYPFPKQVFVVGKNSYAFDGSEMPDSLPGARENVMDFVAVH